MKKRKTNFDTFLSAFMDAQFHLLKNLPVKSDGKNDVGVLLDHKNFRVPPNQRRTYQQYLSLVLNCIKVLRANEGQVPIQHGKRTLRVSEILLFPPNRRFPPKSIFDNLQSFGASPIESPESLNHKYSTPFDNEPLRDWLFENIVCSSSELVFCLGKTPFVAQEFKSFLTSKGVKTTAEENEATVFVVGREGISNFKEIIDKCRSTTICVYSQEMYLSFLLTQKDPLNADEVILKTFTENHPVVEYMGEWDFEWPRTIVKEGNGGTLNTNWPPIGLLKFLGYRVGNNGLVVSERRRILKKCYTTEILPKVINQDYMDEWGQGGSGMRLKKMANSIAAFVRNNKRKNSPNKSAINNWEDDLVWLKSEFYWPNRFKFKWPGNV